MKEVLKKMFESDVQRRISATVRRRISAGTYELQDDNGRVIQAASTLFWSPGTRVLIQQGIIVSRWGGQKSTKTYEV
jgi:hypothetical protein